MKKRVNVFALYIFLILIIISCLYSETIVPATITESISTWTIQPTYTPYPTYTGQPASIREVTRIVVKTRTLAPTPTKTDWRPTAAQYTSLPTVDLSNVPPEIIDRAGVAGMEPYEVVYLFNLFQKVAMDRNPYPLLDFLRFPLHQQGKCPGDVIETPEEFIKKFPSLMTESIRAKILKLKMEDIILTWRGMALTKDEEFFALFASLCADPGCGTSYIVLVNFRNYVIYWEMVYATPGSA